MRGLAYRIGYSEGRAARDRATTNHYRKAGEDSEESLSGQVAGLVADLARTRGDADLDAVREGVRDGIEGRQPSVVSRPGLLDGFRRGENGIVAKRRRHQNKHIEEAIQYAEERGWRVSVGGSHGWGQMYCPHAQRGGCHITIDGTPRVPENIAERLRKRVDRCPHQGRN